MRKNFKLTLYFRGRNLCSIFWIRDKSVIKCFVTVVFNVFMCIRILSSFLFLQKKRKDAKNY